MVYICDIKYLKSNFFKKSKIKNCFEVTNFGDLLREYEYLVSLMLVCVQIKLFDKKEIIYF